MNTSKILVATTSDGSASGEFEALFKKGLSNYTKKMVGRNYYFELNNIYWNPYEDQFSDLLLSLVERHENNSLFVRFGEGINDNEIYGNPKDYGVSVIRKVDYE